MDEANDATIRNHPRPSAYGVCFRATCGEAPSQEVVQRAASLLGRKPSWPPQFIEIEDRWMIRDGMLGFLGYKQDVVQRISVPDLAWHEAISIAEAKQAGVLPDDPWAS